MSPETLTISAPSLRRFIQDAFLAVGMPPDAAETATDVLATADEFGVSTHGVKLLPAYLERLRGGGAKVDGQPRVISEGPAWALVEGLAGLLSGAAVTFEISSWLSVPPDQPTWH